jgi:hypothetical protein
MFLLPKLYSSSYLILSPSLHISAFFFIASSTTKTGCHDIAEILLKVALNTKKSSNHQIIILSQKEEICKVYVGYITRRSKISK